MREHRRGYEPLDRRLIGRRRRQAPSVSPPVGSPVKAAYGKLDQGELATNDPVDLLTVMEAARLLHISRNLAYELVRKGEIPSLRLGRLIRISRPALNRWVQEQTRAS